jgi:hypothetical protein
MTMTTFDGKTVHTTRLTRQYMEGNNVAEWTFSCLTTNSTGIADLVTLMGPMQKTRLLSGKTLVQTSGTKGTLVFNGSSYSNCAIESLTVDEVGDSFAGVLNYSISFVRETYTTT